ncbi:MAG: glutathione S-transferase family protein [Betaproteobacteria bacterium]|nr:MAG: glutathione S-transferase family protein [Betaproteobacteria bacterium]
MSQTELTLIPCTSDANSGSVVPVTPKITLYTAAPSQNAVRPELALLEKGISFDKIQVDLFGGEHKQPAYGEITPRRQVPTLVYGEGDEAITLYESVAIIQFIDDMCPEPPLMPPVSEPAKRAKALMRLAEFQQKLDPKNIFGSVVFRKQTREQLGERVDALLEELPRWDAYVGNGPFLCGEQFTLADIAVFPLLMHFEAIGYDYSKHTPSLFAYMNQCKMRPSVVQSGWIENFLAFAREREPGQVLAG